MRELRYGVRGCLGQIFCGLSGDRRGGAKEMRSNMKRRSDVSALLVGNAIGVTQQVILTVISCITP